ncbi:MAG TPA: glycosyltransferase family 4 protein, partial [Polyangia bacterium]
ELGVADRVRFLGLRNDVENVFAAADVVVVPSTCDEAFCYAAVEGMAAGKPVIVTDSGGMPELMAGGECGVVVPKHDENALAGAVSAILSDDARAQRLGAAARERVAALYTTDRWVAAMLRAYQRLVPSIRLTPPTAKAPSVTTVAPPMDDVAQRSAIG